MKATQGQANPQLVNECGGGSWRDDSPLALTLPPGGMKSYHET
jgi:hypothetical protein